MKIQSKAVIATVAGVAFLMASSAVQAGKKHHKAKAAAPQYELSSAPSIPTHAASNATNSAVQSAVRSARDDAARKAKERQLRTDGAGR